LAFGHFHLSLLPFGTTEGDSMSGAPTHAIWHIRDREGKKAFWTEIGVGFTNRDGSIALKMNLIPIDGGMIVVKPLDRDGRDWRDRDRDDD
jgi:hypothetical protein